MHIQTVTIAVIVSIAWAAFLGSQVLRTAGLMP